MLSKRQKSILIHLFNSDKPITTAWISKVLNVSERTIRNDIKVIQYMSIKLGLKIEFLRGKGYKVKIIDSKLFQQYSDELYNIGISNLNNNFSEQEIRIYYLLNRFLMNGYVKLQTIEDEIFVSKSTIQNDIKEVRKVLEKYNLKLLNRPHYGLYVDGNEFMKRFCLSNYLYKRESNFDYINKDDHLFDKEICKRIKIIIIEKVNKFDIEVSDIALQNLVIHLIIACKRIKEGYSIERLLVDLKEGYTLESVVANEIVKEIEDFMEIVFSDTEINYIIIHLMGIKLLHSENLSEYSKFDEVESIVNCMLQVLLHEFNWDFSQDLELIQALALHIKPAMNRLRYNMNIRNPLLNEIKEKYPMAFEGALKASKCIKDHLGIKIGEHEVAYIALHIGVALERMENKNKKIKRVLLVCASGVGSAKLLHCRINNLFRDELQVMDTISYYKLAEYDLSNIDFIISTIAIKEKIQVPVHVVDTFLNTEDYKTIKNILLHSNQLEETHIYLHPSRIFIKKDLATKESVIHFLSNELIQQNLVPKYYESLVLEREMLASTSFGNLVAIPHPSVPVTKETFWSICTLEHPIRWNDRQMVQLICLLNIKEGNTTDLNEMYKKLAALIENKEIVQFILEANLAEEIMRLLS